jgi:hypothetical protein
MDVKRTERCRVSTADELDGLDGLTTAARKTDTHPAVGKGALWCGQADHEPRYSP